MAQDRVGDEQASASPGVLTVFRLAALFTLLAVIMGSLVCATESGAACPTWPGCRIDAITPGWELNPIIEFTHRLVAILSGPLVLTAAVLSWRVPGRDPRVRILPWVALAGAIAAGVFGRIVVLSHLPLGWAVADLCCALVALVAMTVATVALERGRPRRATPTSRLAWTAVGALIPLHMLGIVVAGSMTDGALSYTRCVGWPVTLIAETDNYPPLQAIRVALGLTVLTSIALVVGRTRHDPRHRPLALALAGLVLLEVVLGIVIRVAGLSSGLAAAFSATAVLLLWTLGLTAARTEVVETETRSRQVGGGVLSSDAPGRRTPNPRNPTRSST